MAGRGFFGGNFYGGNFWASRYWRARGGPTPVVGEVAAGSEEAYRWRKRQATIAAGRRRKQNRELEELMAMGIL